MSGKPLLLQSSKNNIQEDSAPGAPSNTQAQENMKLKYNVMRL